MKKSESGRALVNYGLMAAFALFATAALAAPNGSFVSRAWHWLGHVLAQAIAAIGG